MLHQAIAGPGFMADDRAAAGSGRLWLSLAAITGLAALARLPDLSAQSFWIDEGFTARFIELDWRALWFTAFDNSPPLFYSILKLIGSGTSPEWLLRLPSALAGIGWVAVIVLIVREVGNREAAIFAGMFAAVSSIMIDYSLEARAYALQCMLTALVILATVRLLKEEERLPSATLVLYAAALTLSLYTHVVTIFAWAISGLGVFAWFLGNPAARRQSFVTFVLVNALVLLAWLPWIYLQAFTERAISFNWLTQYPPGEAFRMWRTMHSDVPSILPFPRPLRLVAPAVIALGALAAIRSGGLPRLYLVAIFGGGPLLTYLVGYIQPVFLLRTVVWSSTAACVLFGLSPSWRLIRPAALILGAVAIAMSVSLVLADESRWPKQNFRSAHEFLKANAEDGDDILVIYTTDFSVLSYYERIAQSSLSRRTDIRVISQEEKGEAQKLLQLGRVEGAQPARAGESYEWVVTSEQKSGSEFQHQLHKRMPTISLAAHKLGGGVVVYETGGLTLP